MRESVIPAAHVEVPNGLGASRLPPLIFMSLLVGISWFAWYRYAGPTSPLGLIREYWSVSLTMVFGSLVAGATSEGGGAMAFPVFTKLLSIAPADATVFSLAIQSVGMGAASLTILAMRIPVEWRAVLWVSFGGVPGIWLGSALIAPALPAPVVRICFTIMISSFAVTLYVLNRGPTRRRFSLPALGFDGALMLMGIGLLGGVFSGLVGNGIDILAFSMLVLFFRISESIATPTSVILMALNAMVGFALHYFFIGGFTPEVQDWWLAAIPVVVVGAPLGALCCAMISRRTIVRVLLSLIALELLTSLILIPIGQEVLWASLLALVLFSGLYRWFLRSQRYAIS